MSLHTLKYLSLATGLAIEGLELYRAVTAHLSVFGVKEEKN